MIVHVNTEEEAECGVLSSKHVLRNGTELILILMFQIMHFEKRQV